MRSSHGMPEENVRAMKREVESIAVHAYGGLPYSSIEYSAMESWNEGGNVLNKFKVQLE